jgi:preprotein translocase subunit YajC
VTKRKRLWPLLFTGIAVVAIILLAAGLSELEFSLGQTFFLKQEPWDRSGPVEGTPSPVLAFLLTLLWWLLDLAPLLLPFVVIYFIISREARKQLFRYLVILLWTLTFYVWLRTRVDFLNRAEAVQSPEMLTPGEAESAVEFAATPPQWMVFITSLFLAVLIAAMFTGAVWLVWHRRRRPGNSMEQLAQEVQDALEALQAGSDFKNTVMRCYREMSRVLDEQRGIKRQQAMTPREFEKYLKETGLPGQHVQQLTRLFEGVRYGAKVPDEEKERQAIACLTAIIEACRSSP